MKTLNGRDTAGWNFEHWTKYFDEQDRQLKVLMHDDLNLIEEIGPEPREIEGCYLDEDATVMAVPPFLTAVRFFWAAKRAQDEVPTETRRLLTGYAGYAAYQVIRSHELGYSDDRMMGTTMRIWRGCEVAKKARELIWKERSAVGASPQAVKLHALAERLEQELGAWMAFLCQEHDYNPYRKVGLRRFLISAIAFGLNWVWARLTNPRVGLPLPPSLGKEVEAPARRPGG